MKHEPEHEERLRDWVLEGGGDDDREVVRLFEECAECAQRKGEFTEVLAELAGAADEQVEDLEAAAELEIEPAQGRIEATLRALAEAEPYAEKRPARWLPLVGALAAAFLIGFFLFVMPQEQGDGEEEDVELSEDGIQLQEPLGKVEGGAFGRFAWSYDGTPAEECVLRVYRLVDGERGELVLERRLTESPWTPTPEEKLRMPARIFWEVAGINGFGDEVGWASASAWLSGR